MIESNIINIGIDGIMETIKGKIKKIEETIKNPSPIIRKKKYSFTKSKADFEPHYLECRFDNPEINILLRNSKSFIPQKEYTLKDFTCYHGIDFIKNAYIGILGRDPDPKGLAHHVKILNKNSYSNAKIDILGGLRYSKEGKQQKAKIKNLRKQYFISTIYRLPVLGYLTKSVVTIFRLPNITQKLLKIEKELYMAKATYEANDFALMEALSQKASHSDIVNNIRHVISETRKNFIRLSENNSKIVNEYVSNIGEKIDGAVTEYEFKHYKKEQCQKFAEKVSYKNFNKLTDDLTDQLDLKINMSVYEKSEAQTNALFKKKVSLNEFTSMKEDLIKEVKLSVKKESFKSVVSQIKESLKNKCNNKELMAIEKQLHKKLSNKLSIEQFETANNKINSILGIKANQEQVDTQKQDILNYLQELDMLRQKVNGKLDKAKGADEIRLLKTETRRDLNRAFADLLDKKPSKEDFLNIKELLQYKADRSDIQKLEQTIKTLSSFKVDTKEMSAFKESLLKMLDKKTNKEALTSLKDKLQLELDEKISSMRFDDMNEKKVSIDIYNNDQKLIFDKIKNKANSEQLLTMNHILHQNLSTKVQKNELVQLKRILLANVEKRIHRSEFNKLKKDFEDIKSASLLKEIHSNPTK